MRLHAGNGGCNRRRPGRASASAGRSTTSSLADDPGLMNTAAPSNSFLKRRASRTVAVVADSSSTSSSAASSVIMSVVTPTKPGSLAAAINSKRKKVKQSALREGFKTLGQFCACQPWETIVSFGVIFLTCFYTSTTPPKKMYSPSSATGWAAFVAEYIVYPGQILAFCHFVYRLRNAYLIRSPEIFKFALCYMASILFLFVTISLQDTVEDVWHLVFLLIDIPSVTSLAQFVLCASHPTQISRIVAKGMSVLGPTFAIYTIGKICVFALLFHTNVEQMIRVAWYAGVFSVLNFSVFISVYPAILALYFELTHSRDAGQSRQMVEKLKKFIFVEKEEQNPTVHWVSVCGTALLAIVHILYFWPHAASPSLEDGLFLSLKPIFLYYIFRPFIVVMIAWSAWAISGTDDHRETQESLRSLISFLHKQLDDLDVDTDDNCEETSSSRSDEAMFSSTDEGIGTCSDKKALMRTASSSGGASTIKATVRGEDSSSDWSDTSLYKFTNRNLNNSMCNSAATVQPSQISSNSRQTIESKGGDDSSKLELRSLAECRDLLKTDPTSLTDDEVIQLLEVKEIRVHDIEKVLNDHLRGVAVRRQYLLKQKHIRHLKSLQDLPYEGYNYELVMGACAENVIGYMTLPLGCVGPLKLDGKFYHIPMATTEGCLVASTNRGCTTLTAAGGVTSCLFADGMTRAPILEFANVTKAVEAKEWMEDSMNFRHMKSQFESTSRFAKLLRLDITVAGRKLYVRFVAATGDAMGMNMVSKATEHTLKELQNNVFPDMQIISLSGNMCTDKKPSAMNWIRGRGKSVVCEATIPANILETKLKTTAKKMVKNNIDKNYIGSALAGSIGGNTAHAANIVTAIYIATGQDVAQVVGSSNCLTQIEAVGPEERDLYMTVTMPSIEVGIIGGGTTLPAQAACLEMLGCKPNPSNPGSNSRQLSRIIAAAVLAGELSLMSSLTEGSLVRSHLRHNRSSATVSSMASIADSVSHIHREAEQKRA